jgi:hypothetical protein
MRESMMSRAGFGRACCGGGRPHLVAQVEGELDGCKLDEGGNRTSEGDSTDQSAQERGDFVQVFHFVKRSVVPVRGKRCGNGSQADQSVEGSNGLREFSHSDPLAQDKTSSSTGAEQEKSLGEKRSGEAEGAEGSNHTS